jgi:hypothetical protein
LVLLEQQILAVAVVVVVHDLTLAAKMVVLVVQA